jgi:hypothetical protein
MRARLCCRASWCTRASWCWGAVAFVRGATWPATVGVGGCQLQAWRQHKPVCKLKAKAALLLQQEHIVICFPPLLVYEVWSIQHAAQAAQPVPRGSSRGAVPLVLTVADHGCSQHTTVQLTTHSVC